MKNSRMLIIAATAVCGIAFASVGISQTKTTTTKKTTAVTTESNAKKKIDTTRDDGKTANVTVKKITDEDCLERIKAAFNASKVYFASECRLYINKDNTNTLAFDLGSTTWSTSGGELKVSCFSGKSGCATTKLGKKSSGNLSFFKKDSDSINQVEYCLERFHNRCKEM